MNLNAIKIQDAGKGTKSAVEDLEAVLRKIESCAPGFNRQLRDLLS
jgi:hypothetical protein